MTAVELVEHTAATFRLEHRDDIVLFVVCSHDDMAAAAAAAAAAAVAVAAAATKAKAAYTRKFTHLITGMSKGKLMGLAKDPNIKIVLMLLPKTPIVSAQSTDDVQRDVHRALQGLVASPPVAKEKPSKNPTRDDKRRGFSALTPGMDSFASAMSAMPADAVVPGVHDVQPRRIARRQPRRVRNRRRDNKWEFATFRPRLDSRAAEEGELASWTSRRFIGLECTSDYPEFLARQTQEVREAAEAAAAFTKTHGAPRDQRDRDRRKEQDQRYRDRRKECNAMCNVAKQEGHEIGQCGKLDSNGSVPMPDKRRRITPDLLSDDTILAWMCE